MRLICNRKFGENTKLGQNRSFSESMLFVEDLKWTLISILNIILQFRTHSCIVSFDVSNAMTLIAIITNPRPLCSSRTMTFQHNCNCTNCTYEPFAYCRNIKPIGLKLRANNEICIDSSKKAEGVFRFRFRNLGN